MKFFSWLFKKKQPQKIKLGIALGSGGAKGFAHLGALKAFEEHGIEFDIVAGASIGSVVGAFYAAGYSATDILELLKRIDFGEIKNLFMIKMDTSGMFKVIDREIGQMNIEELKKPFRCTATVLETGKEHVFSSGSVAAALCASSSIPPFFKPVVIDGVRYVDGAFSNSIPADAVKDMGADVVVGIDVLGPLKPIKKKRLNLISTVFRMFEVVDCDLTSRNEKVDTPNFFIVPDLGDANQFDFKNFEYIYQQGYKCGKEYAPKIKESLEEK